MISDLVVVGGLLSLPLALRWAQASTFLPCGEFEWLPKDVLEAIFGDHSQLITTVPLGKHSVETCRQLVGVAPYAGSSAADCLHAEWLGASKGDPACIYRLGIIFGSVIDSGLLLKVAAALTGRLPSLPFSILVPQVGQPVSEFSQDRTVVVEVVSGSGAYVQRTWNWALVDTQRRALQLADGRFALAHCGT